MSETSATRRGLTNAHEKENSRRRHRRIKREADDLRRGETPQISLRPEARAGGDDRRIKEQTRDWEYDAVSVGFPAPVRNGKIATDKPKHLGKGWLEYDFEKALGKPTRVINDAALQALGSYRDGRMLFLGFGTGLGSALVWDGYVLSLELGDLPYVDHEIIEAQIGDAALEEMGKKEWRKEALYIVEQLKSSFIADHVVLGGGNAGLLEDELPDGVELGPQPQCFPGRRAPLGDGCQPAQEPEVARSSSSFRLKIR